ncbi:hypothetical protein [Nocardioides psychrotolerans]|uniref:Uncharacterized protein n=1 Tax=Nocardioides psychrotolerans TaxID=1005945 RepID=A0A1I3CI93_9ACTN|nr:hypothetical protein [Nocardioides psychrotolerans]SFH74314.1 hypothetical protein SAMN05216561_10278 [Nocardioides psychrotolerans]
MTDSSALEGQRERARAAAAVLVTGVVDALGGSASRTTGRVEGCESASEDEFRTFRYTATGRVDVGASASPPFLDALVPVLEAAGFADPIPGERPGGNTLEGSDGDLTATLSELPGQGAYVLLSVEGPCLEVPEADRRDWQRRTDPEPFL